MLSGTAQDTRLLWTQRVGALIFVALAVLFTNWVFPSVVAKPGPGGCTGQGQLYGERVTLTISGPTATEACTQLFARDGWRSVDPQPGASVVCQSTPVDGNKYSISNWWWDTRDLNACDQLTRHGL
jgi:hypothetical protein